MMEFIYFYYFVDTLLYGEIENVIFMETNFVQSVCEIKHYYIEKFHYN